MGKWWNRVLLLFIVALTAFSVYAVWPSEPERYLPDFIPWPEGQGVKLKVPAIEGNSFGLKTIERRAMSLGLDLRGGTRLVLEPEPGQQIDNLDEALDGARDIIEMRVNAFGVAESEVNRLGSDRLAVQLPGIDPGEAIEKIGRTALLQFCEPVMDESGNVAIARQGKPVYQPQTCDPVLDSQGLPQVEGGTVEFAPWSTQGGNAYTDDQIIWRPAAAEIDGQKKELTGNYLNRNTTVAGDAVGNPILTFEWTGDGADVSEEVTGRLAERNYPLAPFLDGEPLLSEDGTIIAPRVQSAISASGQITGLSLQDAQDLRKLLNIGAFPVKLKVVQQQDVDATLGETAVRNSVIAGQIALLLIMLFMIVYYRLPGVMASLALVVYTSVLLAIFKLWPVTLTLAGVAAFILSVGMAVDANILIFERMKEEVRLGRNLRVGLEAGFSRAWSSIRDSNVSTLITCAILYWFGNQFGESAIKGFAITLAIGVLVSMFSAITVSRTFMRIAVSFRPLGRRPWLFVADLPDEVRRTAQAAPAVAGGAPGGRVAAEEES